MMTVAAGAASPLGRPAPADSANHSGSGGGSNEPGREAAPQELPPILGHVSGSLQVTPAPSAGGRSSGRGDGRGSGEVGAPDGGQLLGRRGAAEAHPAGSGSNQISPFAPTFGVPEPSANSAAGSLPAKAAADTRQGLSGGDGGNGKMRPGAHVGLTHVELGPAGSSGQHAASNASRWTAGRTTATGRDEAAGSGTASGGAAGGSGDLDVAVSNANRWMAARVEQRTAQTAASNAAGNGSNRSSDDGSGHSGGEP